MSGPPGLPQDKSPGMAPAMRGPPPSIGHRGGHGGNRWPGPNDRNQNGFQDRGGRGGGRGGRGGHRP